MGSGGRWHGGGDCVLLPQVEALQVGINLCYFHIWSDSLSWLLVYVLRADKFWIVRKPVTNFFFILILLTIGISKCSRIVNAVERFPEKNILFQAEAWVDTIFLSWCCLFLLEIDALILPLVCVHCLVLLLRKERHCLLPRATDGMLMWGKAEPCACTEDPGVSLPFDFSWVAYFCLLCSEEVISDRTQKQSLAYAPLACSCKSHSYIWKGEPHWILTDKENSFPRLVEIS